MPLSLMIAVVLLLVFAAVIALRRPGLPASAPTTGSAAVRPPPPQTSTLVDLLDRPPNERDETWSEQLTSELPRGMFVPGVPVAAAGLPGAECLSAQAVASGRGWVSFGELVRQASDEGMGLVLTSRSGGVRTELSFSLVATLQMFRARRAPTSWSGPERPLGTSTVKQDSMVQVGKPNEEYLPKFVRVALRKRLQALGVAEPRVLLVLWPEDSRRDLVFNLYRADFPSPEAFEAAVQSLLWYLPDGYQVLGGDAFVAQMAAAATL